MEPKDPIKTAQLPELAKKKTGELAKTKPGIRRSGSLSRIELYAYCTVFALVFISGFVIPQPVLDDNEFSILLFVLIPLLGWGVRVYYKAYPSPSASDYFGD